MDLVTVCLIIINLSLLLLKGLWWCFVESIKDVWNRLREGPRTNLANLVTVTIILTNLFRLLLAGLWVCFVRVITHIMNLLPKGPRTKIANLTRYLLLEFWVCLNRSIICISWLFPPGLLFLGPGRPPMLRIRRRRSPLHLPRKKDRNTVPFHRTNLRVHMCRRSWRIGILPAFTHLSIALNSTRRKSWILPREGRRRTRLCARERDLRMRDKHEKRIRKYMESRGGEEDAIDKAKFEMLLRWRSQRGVNTLYDTGLPMAMEAYGLDGED